MASLLRPLIAANWKMNGLLRDGAALAHAITRDAAASPLSGPEIVLCPPATLLTIVASALAGTSVRLGGQDCHAEPSGPFTGDIAAAMLRDIGCLYVIVGHSERRGGHHETDAIVRAKAVAALAAGLIPIICVGESDQEREAGQAHELVTRQVRDSLPPDADVARVVIAYEPIWAIGTGKSAEPGDILEMHGAIRDVAADRLESGRRVRILYGGSVKPANAEAVLALDGVDGALVGGASLDAAAFWSIVKAAPHD